MKYNLILESWKKFLTEEEINPNLQANTNQDKQKIEQEEKIKTVVAAIQSSINTAAISQKETIQTIPDKQALRDQIKKAIDEEATLKESLQEAKKKKKKKKKSGGDRCTRIAKRKYDVWPSAYASGAVVKCRQGKIWKGISESMTDEEIDDALLLEDIEEIALLDEKWSAKYKKSINCKNPKGFSQRAHCQGRKKNEELELDVELVEEAKKKKPYKPNFSKEKEQGLHGWFARNKGKGWINCRTGGPCGRESADSGGKYPACRPTKAQCKSAGKGPLRKKKSSKAISWTKKKSKD